MKSQSHRVSSLNHAEQFLSVRNRECVAAKFPRRIFWAATRAAQIKIAFQASHNRKASQIIELDDGTSLRVIPETRSDDSIRFPAISREAITERADLSFRHTKQVRNGVPTMIARQLDRNAHVQAAILALIVPCFDRIINTIDGPHLHLDSAAGHAPRISLG